MTSRYKILVWAGCAQLSSQVTKYTKSTKSERGNITSHLSANYCLVLIKHENNKRHLFKRLRYVCFHQCLLSTSSGRRLSLFSVSYPMTIMTDVGMEEMMRADRPLVRPHVPSSARSCLKVSITDERPSTCTRARTTSMGLVRVEAVAAAIGPATACRRRCGQSAGASLESCSP